MLLLIKRDMNFFTRKHRKRLFKSHQRAEKSNKGY